MRIDNGEKCNSRGPRNGFFRPLLDLYHYRRLLRSMVLKALDGRSQYSEVANATAALTPCGLQVPMEISVELSLSLFRRIGTLWRVKVQGSTAWWGRYLESEGLK